MNQLINRFCFYFIAIISSVFYGFTVLLPLVYSNQLLTNFTENSCTNRGDGKSFQLHHHDFGNL